MDQQKGEFVDYYKLLDLDTNASSIQIRQAFIKKAKHHHPDVGGSTESMRLLNLAYKTLASHSHKAAYDLLHSFHTGTNQINYKVVDPQPKAKSSSDNLSDEYVDWFLDTIYAEYSTKNKPKLTFSKLVKKFFSI